MKYIYLPYKKSNKPIPVVMQDKTKKYKKSIDTDSLDKCLNCNKINCICNEKTEENDIKLQ